MPDNIDDKIEPAGFDADSSPFDSVQSSVSISSKPANSTWLVLGVLVIVALCVIFVLPTIVSEYQLPFEKRAELDTSIAPRTAASNINIISPFDEAQKSRQRKDAQDVLASLLERQTLLEDAQVRKWAEEPYRAAYEIAFTSGDEAYRAQEFIQAKDYYQHAADEFQLIIESIPAVVSQYLSAGESALENVNSALASEKFSIVLALDSENEQAISGFNRTQTLDEVESLLDEGAVSNEAGNLEAARDLYQQAVNLDQLHEGAKALVVQINSEIIVARFTRLMSEGFSLLESSDYNEAIEHFRRAQAVGYNSQQAVAAIEQAQNQITSMQISAIQISAQEYEEAESWELAVLEYTKALELDKNLAQVIDKKGYAEKRLQLDKLLQSAIDSPERLAETPVYDQILNVYYTGKQIENPDSKLQNQLLVLEGLLLHSQISIEVVFQSDSITDVTLLKVGYMGSFENTTVALKPGRYVVVGKRDGYKDVREEFVIGYEGKEISPVLVACSEQINGR